ncbi:uncharacterized protein FA14DRAFT_191977 [Meira miltonrushii]|uniref:Uncharacterized protein n=1 Tax=Meira miltonrushii TaxID=1280837 RepID=A0A316V5Z7_9BASI|nr:uncharacterized protein FA14DRAFT_191977 [Meira miltonrushii]PWN32916.1 hypothetical protein FA14DRAFT_191977 [Meira miltonrushii]
MQFRSLLVGAICILTSLYQVGSTKKGATYSSEINTALVLKRSLSSDDSKAVSKSALSEDHDVRSAAATLMDISSSHTPKPIDEIHVPQKARSSRKRKASEIAQATTVPIYSKYSDIPTSYRVLSQKREFLAKKRIANNLRYRKARELLGGGENSKEGEYNVRSRRLKKNPAKSTLKNRKWMAKMQREDPQKFQKTIERKRASQRKFWQSLIAEKTKQKGQESD